MESDCLMSLLIVTFDRNNYSGSEDFQLVNDDGEIVGTVNADISNRERPANRNSTPRRKGNVSKIEEKVSDERILIEKKNKAIDKTTVKTIQASPAKHKTNKMDKENKKKDPQK